MRRRAARPLAGARGVVAAALLLVLDACSATPPSASPSQAVAPASTGPASSAEAPTTAPTPSLAPTSTPTPSAAAFAILLAEPPPGFVSPIACTGKIGATDPVAIVQLRAADGGFGDVVLRDYADTSNPTTVCTMPTQGVLTARLIDARHLLITASSEAGGADRLAVVDVPEVRFHWFQLPKTAGWGSRLITVAPGLDRVVWKSVDPEGAGADSIHVTTVQGDRIVATLRDTNGGRCGQREDSNEGAYTTSGSYLYVLNQPFAADNSLVVFEGESSRFSVLPPGGSWARLAWPSMAVWSPTSPTLYFGQGDAIWKWTPSGGKEKFIAHTVWFRPTISSDGKHLAYQTIRVDGGNDVYLVDLDKGAAPVRIGAGRGDPVFLNSRQLWYLRDNTADGCTGGGTPRELVYDVTTHSEAGSIIKYVWAVWPATSSNH